MAASDQALILKIATCLPRGVHRRSNHQLNLALAAQGPSTDDRNQPALENHECIETMLDRCIGLWDVIASAKREGSSDAAMRAIEANPLARFATELPQVRAFAFNGGTPASIGRRQLKGLKAPTLVDLPSSSGQNSRMTLALKTESWLELRKFL